MIDYEVNPAVEPRELFAFYERNNICEVGYGEGPAQALVGNRHRQRGR